MACQDQALADFNDAQQTCQAGFVVRQTACDKLGPAPYDPVIDSLNNAEDFAQTLSLNEVVTVRFGTFNHCLKSGEKSPLEPDVLEDKFYAPGIGSVLEVDRSTGATSELVRIIRGQ